MKPTRPNILMHRWGLGLFWLWLLLGGCSGCGKHPAPEPPVAQSAGAPTAPQAVPAEARQTPVPAAVPQDAPPAQRAVSDTDFFARTREWIPWEPTVVSTDAHKRSQKRIKPLYQRYKTGHMPLEEYQKKMQQINAEELGTLTYARRLAENDANAATYARKAYAENPDDFETLITFACRGGLVPYGEEMTAAFRRLHEMQPAHPFVLHKLALCIYPTQPAEALGYAQKAQQLDPRYLAFGAEGLCYFQMGDYPKALAAFQRAYPVAPEKLKPGSGEQVRYVLEVMENEALQTILQRKRERGIPLMYPAMWSH